MSFAIQTILNPVNEKNNPKKTLTVKTRTQNVKTVILGPQIVAVFKSQGDSGHARRAEHQTSACSAST